MLNLKFHFQNGEVLDACYRCRLDVSKNVAQTVSTRWPHVSRVEKPGTCKSQPLEWREQTKSCLHQAIASGKLNLVILLNCCPQGILAQSPAKLEMNSSSVVTCAQIDALCCCGSFPLSQNGFSSPNIAARRVLRAKLQLSSCALLIHLLAPAKALQQEVCRWLRVIYWSVLKLKFLN